MKYYAFYSCGCGDSFGYIQKGEISKPCKHCGDIFKGINKRYRLIAVKEKNMFKRICFYSVVIFTLSFVLFGCATAKCRPDARLENKKGDWYVGGVCEGEFEKEKENING